MSVPFEYALLRVIPRIDRGEQVNIGVVLYCQAHDRLIALTHVDEARLAALWPDLDLAAVRAAADALTAACEQPATDTAREGGGLGARFRWLTAPRSTVLQPGPVHAGMTDDPVTEARQILARMVRMAPGPGR